MFVNVRAIVERNIDNQRQILIQTRNKINENNKCIELPGGRLDEFESLIEGLKREVFEETGLVVSEIEGIATKIDTNTGDNNVECLRPFAVYQTTKGPVDSMGVYFRCKAEGTLLHSGDETEGVRWIDVSDLHDLFRKNADQFCWVDRAGIQFYLSDPKCSSMH